MENKNPRIIIAVDNSGIRKQVSEVINLLNCTPEVLARSWDIRIKVTEEDIKEDIVILETNDDAAALTQSVYEMYKATQVDYTLWIIGMLSKEQMERNPRVARWGIDHHAALLILLTSDGHDMQRELRAMINRLINQ